MIVVVLRLALLIVHYGFRSANATHRVRARFPVGARRVRATAFQLLHERRLACRALLLHQLAHDGLNSFGGLLQLRRETDKVLNSVRFRTPIGIYRYLDFVGCVRLVFAENWWEREREPG